MKYPFIKYGLILLGIYLLGACQSGRDKKNRVFHYNESTGIASLDPAFAKNQSVMWPIHQLFNQLVEVDSNMKIVPSLAKSWSISEDRKVYTFHLRDDVFFHDDGCFPDGKGRKLVAADFVFSFNRILDPALASPGAWIFNGRVLPDQPFTALNDTLFQLRLIRPYSPILGILSMMYCSVIPKEAIEKYGKDFRRHPVGTGPFHFRAWEEGLSLILNRNPRYFERDSAGNPLPYLDGVQVSFFDSKATEFLLFRQGKLDFINDIDASFKDEVLTKKGTLKREWLGKIQLQTHPYLNTEYLGILVDPESRLLKESPLRLKKIRQAINYAFDRQKMILYLRNSMGTPAESGFVPAGLPSFSPEKVVGYSYNPKRARDLLAESGFPGGRGLPAIKLLTIPIYSDMAGFIAGQLAESGIPVQVEVVQKSLLLELTASGRASFFRGSWIADYPDAENYLSVFHSINPAPPNYTRFRNPEFDRLLDKAINETNDSLRYTLYQEADRIIVEEAPVVPLWYDKVVRLVQPQVKGFKPNGLNLLELRSVYK